jgi:hypothetical protein
MKLADLSEAIRQKISKVRSLKLADTARSRI